MNYDTDSMRIGSKLKELRIAHGYKQADVAAAADITQQAYSAYESGKRTPSSVPLYKIANFYGLQTDDLLNLCMKLDEDIFFEAKPQSQNSLKTEDFLAFVGNEKYASLTQEQRELLYYFTKLEKTGKKDIIDYAAYKLEREKLH